MNRWSAAALPFLTGWAQGFIHPSARADAELQVLARAADLVDVSWVHECTFCGWSRPAAGPTMLAPTCERCGCVLEAYPASERPAEAALVPVQTRPSRVARFAPALLLLAPTALAARIGLDHGGVLLAVLAAVLTLMLLGGLGYRRP